MRTTRNFYKTGEDLLLLLNCKQPFLVSPKSRRAACDRRRGPLLAQLRGGGKERGGCRRGGCSGAAKPGDRRDSAAGAAECRRRGHDSCAGRASRARRATAAIARQRRAARSLAPCRHVRLVPTPGRRQACAGCAPRARWHRAGTFVSSKHRDDGRPAPVVRRRSMPIETSLPVTDMHLCTRGGGTSQGYR